MITDSLNIIEKFKCKKILARYLLYVANIPLLFVDDNFYYFVNNQTLKDALKELPFYLKILRIFPND